VTFPLTIIEPGIGQWRSADIGPDELPTDLRFHDDSSLNPQDAIFSARVTAVDNTLDMAFLDLGAGRTGSLTFRRARMLAEGQAKKISDCVKEGDRLAVQVQAQAAAEENKAYSVTARPRITGRYVVLEMGKPRLNFSKDLTARKIKDLKELLAPLVDGSALIVRSRAGDVPLAAVVNEAKRLIEVFTTTSDKPGLLHTWSPAEKALLSAPDTEGGICVEGGSAQADLKAIAAKHWPDLAGRITAYTGKIAGFEEYGVEEAIEDALAERIDLPSGGWISITPTPALTAVDVNMGGALKGMGASEAMLVVNLEATLALMYHLRFQDIGGLIVVDYINMSTKGSNRQLVDLIERTAREDKVPLQHTGISAFGLVEFTRKRSGLSLRDRTEYRPQPIVRPVAMALTLLRKAARVGRSKDVGNLIIAAPKATIAWLERNKTVVADLTKVTGRDLILEQSATADVFIRR